MYVLKLAVAAVTVPIGEVMADAAPLFTSWMLETTSVSKLAMSPAEVPTYFPAAASISSFGVLKATLVAVLAVAVLEVNASFYFAIVVHSDVGGATFLFSKI